MVPQGGSRSGIIWLFSDKRLFPAISRGCHAAVRAILSHEGLFFAQEYFSALDRLFSKYGCDNVVHGKDDICPSIYSLESCPTRARGLKFICLQGLRTDIMSCPTRARGLKFHQRSLQSRRDRVVPHAGTWIEIRPARRRRARRAIVVPHAGTWIEIPRCRSVPGVASVVPHAGTWIEMRLAGADLEPERSCPTRARGLKCRPSSTRDRRRRSCPTRARGLKSRLAVREGLASVRRAPRGHVD